MCTYTERDRERTRIYCGRRSQSNQPCRNSGDKDNPPLSFKPQWRLKWNLPEQIHLHTESTHEITRGQSQQQCKTTLKYWEQRRRLRLRPSGARFAGGLLFSIFMCFRIFGPTSHSIGCWGLEKDVSTQDPKHPTSCNCKGICGLWVPDFVRALHPQKSTTSFKIHKYQNWDCLGGELLVGLVWVFSTMLEPPNAHIRQNQRRCLETRALAIPLSTPYC